MTELLGLIAGLYGATLIAALGWNLVVALVSYCRLRWLQRQRRNGVDDGLDPAAVVFLIHGTWARNAAWTQPLSKLRNAVEQALGPGKVKFEHLDWSGRNRFSARSEAAERLRREITRSLKRWPTAPHYVIGHSHGGNVALSALGTSPLAAQVAGLICLSTPFLLVRKRQLGVIASFGLYGAPAALVLYGGGFILRRCCSGLADHDGVVLLLLVLAVVVAITVSRLARRVAQSLQQTSTRPRISPDRVLILRAPGDEASAGLGAAHLLSWIAGKTWSTAARVVSEAYETVERWNSSIARHNRLILTASIGALVLGGYLLIDQSLQPSQLRDIVATAMVTAALVVFAIRIRGGLSAQLLGIVFAGLLVAPLPVLLAIAALPIGPELVLAALLLEVTAEATPPGTWIVHQLGGDDFRVDGRATHGGDAPPHSGVMMHSLSYDNPIALRQIAAWLTKTPQSGRLSDVGQLGSP